MKRSTIVLVAALLGGTPALPQPVDVFGGVLDGPPTVREGAGAVDPSATGGDYVTKAARIPCQIMAEVFFNVGSGTYGYGTEDDERRMRRTGRGKPTFPETSPAAIPPEAWNKPVFDAFARRAMECSSQRQRGMDYAVTSTRLGWMAASMKAAENKRQEDDRLRQYRQEEVASRRAGLVASAEAQVADAEAQQSSAALSPRLAAIDQSLADSSITDDVRGRLAPRIDALRTKLSKLRSDEVAALERDRASREARAAQENDELARLEKANRERADALAVERARRAKLDDERQAARRLDIGQEPSSAPSRPSPTSNEAVAQTDKKETTDEMMDRMTGRSRVPRQAQAQSQASARPGLDIALLRELCPAFATGSPGYEQTNRRLSEEGRRATSMSPAERASNHSEACRPYSTKMDLFQTMRNDLAKCVGPGADPAIGSSIASLEESIVQWKRTTAGAGCVE